MRWTRAAGRTATTVLITAGALLGAAPGAAAAPPWLTPQDLAAPTEEVTVGAPDVAMARDGAAHVAFLRRDGVSTRAFVASRAPGGTFGPAVPLSDAGTEASGVQIAVDRQGNVTATWLRGTVVEAAFRRLGQNWGPADDVSGTGASAPNLAVGDDGAAAATWTEPGSAPVQELVAVAVRPAGAASFAPSTFVSPVSATPQANQIDGLPRIAMDRAGDLAVLWQRRFDVGGGMIRRVMEAVTRPTAGAFTVASARSSTGGNASLVSFDLGISPTGRALAIWDYADAATPLAFVVEFSEFVPGATFATGTWRPRSPLSPPGVSSFQAKVAIDDTGSVVGTWSANDTVQSTVRPTPDGAFSSPKALSGTGASAASAVIAAAPGGEAVIVWPGASGPDSALFSARRRADGDDFGEVTEVVRGTASGSPSVFYSAPAIGLDNQGNAFGAWARRTFDGATNSYTAQAAGFDPVPPALAAVTVPSSGLAGASTSFAAAAVDRMSPVTISWLFGDGGSATGASASHVYPGGGAFTVTAAATDGAGNRAEAARPILIGAAPPAADPDADRDGVPDRLDCDDANPQIRQGAREIRGNRVDEDCSGRADPYLRVAGSPVLTWNRLRSGRTQIRTLKVERLQRGDVVTLSCQGRGCRKRAARRSTARRTTLSLTKPIAGMVLSAKARLTVKITRTGATGRIVRYTMVRGRDPRKAQRCQDPGAKRTRPC